MVVSHLAGVEVLIYIYKMIPEKWKTDILLND